MMRNCKMMTGVLALVVFGFVLTGCFGLSPVGKVDGAVTYHDGTPVEYALIKLGNMTTQTNATGSFNFRNVKHGTYDLSVSVAGQVVHLEKVNVSQGPVTVTIELDPMETSTVSGVVSWTDGTPVADAVVLLGLASTTTDGTGTYSFNNVIYGEHSFQVKVDNELVFSTTVTVDKEQVEFDVELGVFNGSFEELAAGVHVTEALGKVPLGWIVSPPKDATAWRIGLTDEEAFDGSLAIKVEVEEKQGGIMVSSRPIEVEPGRTYTALANVYNVDDPALDRYPIQLYLQFWSEDGWWGDTDYWSEASWAEQSFGRWSTSKRIDSKWVLSKMFDEWEEVMLVADAPAGAKYVTIDIWTANRSMTAYVDGIRLSVTE